MGTTELIVIGVLLGLVFVGELIFAVRLRRKMKRAPDGELLLYHFENEPPYMVVNLSVSIGELCNKKKVIFTVTNKIGELEADIHDHRNV